MQKEVEFKSGNLTLRGTLFLPDEKEGFGGALLLHGSGSRRKNYLPIAAALADKGLAALAFDFRGCGESEGNFEDSTVNDNVKDARSALGFLLTIPGINHQRIGLVGASRGGHVAAVIAGENSNIASLILRAPVAYPQDLVDRPKHDRQDSRWLKEKSRWVDSPALKAIANFKNFLLIIESELDESITREMLEEYQNQAGARFTEIQTIKGVGHNLGAPDSAFREEFKNMVVTWFFRES